MGKRTYSQRDKRRSAHEIHGLPNHNDDDSRKRYKADEPDELHLSTPRSSGKGIVSTLLKKGLKPKVPKKFRGPTSLPELEDEIDIDSAPESSDKRSVFEKVLRARYQPVKPLKPTIHGSRDEFAEAMKDGRRSKAYNGEQRNSHLPTPPVEFQTKAHQQARRDSTFAHINGAANKPPTKTPNGSSAPTETSQLFEKIIKYEQPKEPYVTKLYKSEETLAPRRTIEGVRMSSTSGEAQMWSANQTNSLFLQLPEQVRTLVYEYALGGKTINIGFETYRTTYKSNRPKQPQTVDPIFKYHCTVFNTKTNPFRATALPYIKMSTGFTPLNNICRQLYKETATLPYKLNFLSFASQNIMFNFLCMEKRLSRQQLDAITQLVLPDALPGSNVLSSLRNLERVYLAFDIDNRGWYRVVRQEGQAPKLVRAVKELG
ncbi:hypothetical protein EJ02DRAFT_382413 [Clathrospora elynae]|uniref:DUF7730 domain-containing protein n=1 Tax=Clathrospora elynae TaxID=706981 RepID=A0A6A5SI84_9PLEO|nr:hypothetical protein EJ02DRAFT_382413 [Clathrospora elynae]